MSILDFAPIGLAEAKPLHGCPHADPRVCCRRQLRGCGGIFDWGNHRDLLFESQSKIENLKSKIGPKRVIQ